MDAKEFSAAYAEAFGPAAGLPLLFWYSEVPVRTVPKTEGCFFKALGEALRGASGKPQCREYRLRGRKVLHRVRSDAAVRADLRVAEGAL